MNPNKLRRKIVGSDQPKPSRYKIHLKSAGYLCFVFVWISSHGEDGWRVGWAEDIHLIFDTATDMNMQRIAIRMPERSATDYRCVWWLNLMCCIISNDWNRRMAKTYFKNSLSFFSNKCTFWHFCFQWDRSVCKVELGFDDPLPLPLRLMSSKSRLPYNYMKWKQNPKLRKCKFSLILSSLFIFHNRSERNFQM